MDEGAGQVDRHPTSSGGAAARGAGRLGPLVRDHRHRRGLTLDQLAERCGCAKSYLSAIETGRRGPPGDGVLERLEAALFLEAGTLVRVAAWDRLPESVRADVSRRRSAEAERPAARAEALRRVREILEGGGVDGDGRPVGGLDEAYRSGEFRRLIDRLDPQGAAVGEAVAPVDLPFEVPLINKVAAGYPTGFTDLGFPARVADDYVRCPDLHDPDAFAARVVGDSMEPEYREGDIVVFSPARALKDGDDCFARLAPDDESTFKRVYFEREGERERIRLQPINSRYPPRVLDREEVSGLYRAVKVLRDL